MPTLFRTILGRFDAIYRDQAYLVGRKARLLAVFCLLVFVFVPLNIVKLILVQPPGLMFRFGFNAIFLATAAMSLRWLLKGRVQTAGNGFALMALIPVHAMIVFIPEFREPVGAAITLFCYDIVCLLLALVFASRLIAFILLAVMVAAQLAFHFLMLESVPIAGSLSFAANTLIRDGLISTAFVFCLGVTLAVLIETAHKRIEESLREVRAVNTNLERLVRERTKELEAATALANEASRAKGDFLANMSHEIRTPLHAIIASSELLLRRDDLSPEAAEKSRIIAQSGELLLRQIGDILDVSKIESGRMDLESAPFALVPLVRDSVALMASQAASDALDIRFSPAPGLPACVMGDSFRLRQVLLNLISNAIKFTPPGGRIEILVTREANQGETARIRFAIQDSGIGMDEDTVQRIFQRFTQADSSTTRKFGGTGLGLSISSHLVELMGGRLEAASKPGAGSLFHFTLPFGVVDAVEDPFGGKEDALEQFDLNVLVADDNQINRQIISLQLRKLGCRCSAKSDGMELLDALQRETLPDLILVDCEMPVMDGFEATRRIRAWAGDPGATGFQKAAAQIPVIALTAATSAQDRNNCLAAGMTGFLAKPVRLSDLQSLLKGFSPGCTLT